jgi:EAL domain-containing protein (putative c-di-GMP-specific phosphodiesterase class I)
MSLEDNKVVGFEALLRWLHPDLGILCPAEFITVAEETGLIIPIGEWVIRQACLQMSSWQKRFPGCRDLSVSANVSSVVFFQPDFYKIIEDILQETGIEASCLRLEIKERMLMEHPEPAAVLMKRLRDLNVLVDVDDFGSGYSALNYLRHFPIRGLKIDGSFINALTYDKGNAAIVKTIVALGNTLNLVVIAEGIETMEQLEVFKSMNGQHGQGFFLHRPMDSKAAENLLPKGRF